MGFDELDELNSQDADDAEAAIAELVSTSNIDELAQLAKARADRVALRAIEGLAEVGGAEATTALVELLEATSVPRVIWGTEQERENERRQSHLVQSLARVRGVPAPAGRSQEDIAEFIEESRRS
jgi:hypothetical protein